MCSFMIVSCVIWSRSNPEINDQIRPCNMNLRNYFFFLFLSIISLQSFAQEAYEKLAVFSLGTQSAFGLDVAGANKQMAEEALKTLCSFAPSSLKQNKKAKEWQLIGVTIPSVRNKDPWDVYVHIEELKNSITVSFGFDTGSAFLNNKENADASEAVRAWLREYYLLVAKKVVEEEIRQEEEKLQDLKKELTKSQQKELQLQKEIEKAKLKIAENEKAIELNLTAQNGKKAQIAEQEAAVKKAMDKYNTLGRKD